MCLHEYIAGACVQTESRSKYTFTQTRLPVQLINIALSDCTCHYFRLLEMTVDVCFEGVDLAKEIVALFEVLVV